MTTAVIENASPSFAAARKKRVWAIVSMSLLIVFMGLVLVVCSSCKGIDTTPLGEHKPENADEQQQYEALIKEARDLYDVQPRNEARLKKAAATYADAMKLNSTEHETLWQAARACNWLASYAQGKDVQIAYANAGIAYARTAIKIKEGSTEGLFYLSVLSGRLAFNDHAYGLSAVDLIDESCRKIVESGKDIEHGGAHRVRGLVLINPELPGPPTSIGSLRNGKKALELAVQVAPDWPENHLALAQAEFLWAADKEKPEIAQQARDRLYKYLLGPEAKTPKGYEQEFADWQKQARELLAKNP